MDWMKGLSFSGEYLLPIQNRINLNTYSVSILKKYISKSYIEKPENINLLVIKSD